MSKSYEKILTKNDTAETGGHQAGITVPKKDSELLRFFPSLDLNEFNPDAYIECIDPDGERWQMRYVFYNGKTFTPPRSTRNEYRITYMTRFFSKWRAKSGDSVIFTSTDRVNVFKVRVKKQEDLVEETESAFVPKKVVLKGWRPVF